jgi:hypothetical protein
MLDVRNEIEVGASKEVVFSLLTTPHFWPSWHVSTRAVSGVTDQPYRLGESFEEHATIAEQPAELVWTCVAHDAPHAAAIETREKSVRISYLLHETNGRTKIARQLTVDPTQAAAQQLLWTVSQQSLVRFCSFVRAKHPTAPSHADSVN